jgi:hypothetical protein
VSCESFEEYGGFRVGDRVWTPSNGAYGRVYTIARIRRSRSARSGILVHLRCPQYLTDRCVDIGHLSPLSEAPAWVQASS